MVSYLIVLSVMLLIVIALARGLWTMLHHRNQSKQTVKALTLRIAASVLLFVFLFFAFWRGWIRPHGIYQSSTTAERMNQAQDPRGRR